MKISKNHLLFALVLVLSIFLLSATGLIAVIADGGPNGPNPPGTDPGLIWNCINNIVIKGLL